MLTRPLPIEECKFLIYPTLLDAFTRYQRAEELHEERWKFVDDAEKVPEFSWEEAKQELIDRINRVPFESEKADRGTAFNQLIDRLNMRPTWICHAETEGTDLVVEYGGRKFRFERDKVLDIAKRYKGAAQVYVERTIDTCKGKVLLYGYIDELLFDRITDIKTTTSYHMGKYRYNWQHIVYPYCINADDVRRFDYDVFVFDKKGRISEEYTETYYYDPQRDDERLRQHIEDFIFFIESNRASITDRKVFNDSGAISM